MFGLDPKTAIVVALIILFGLPWLMKMIAARKGKPAAA